MTRRGSALPGVLLAVVGVAALSLWLSADSTSNFVRREPGQDERPDPSTLPSLPRPVGVLTRGDGTPGTGRGSWPGFRGPGRDGIGTDPGRLLTAWPDAGPRRRWAIDVGEGYAGAAIHAGRVYLMDYDRDAGADTLRCLSFDDGREIWHFAYPVKVKRNHGMSRTVPAVTDRHVVGLGPKCHVTCLDATTGEECWMIDLVRDHGATVPQWYAGQCPLLDEGRAILAPCGPEALVLAVALETGETVWTTPNPFGWTMTHASIVRASLCGVPTYVVCGSRGVAGVSVETGDLLWHTDAWKISIATVPSPVPVGDDRVFFSGGYNAGSLMLRIERDDTGALRPRVVFRLGPETFGATQQTPILYKGHLYGVRPDGQLTCLGLDGHVAWTSGARVVFGLCPFLVADDLLYAMDEDGGLSLIRAVPDRFERLAHAQVLDGREPWGPLALAGGRLIARDLTRLVCLEVGAP